jgi:crotonobetainyl-CoA:carnitine CoA-transferase CaiB-like acyl-CoA transferase
MPEQSARGPLSGYVIVDLTTMVMGPMATQILGDLGAEVVKVERPSGDPQRYPLPSRHPTMNGVFLNLNRNKRSIAVDLQKKEGAELIRGFCRRADVVVSSMRRGSARKLALDYESIKKVKPDIVYCVANGFGEGGPYSGKPAYDDVIQAASGIAGLLQEVRGQPQYLPIALCDKVAGMTMVYAIIAALLHRERTGQGQEIETPMFEASVAFNLVEHVCGYAFDPPLGQFGWKRILAERRRPYRTKDAFACIMPYSDQNWSDFFVSIGRPELVSDPRFVTYTLRIEHTDELYKLLEDYAPQRTTAEWSAFCDSKGIPFMPVILPTALWDDEQIKSSGLLGIAEHPTEGRYRTIGPPVRFGLTPASICKHAPNLGEDTIDVAAQAGLSKDEIEHLLRSGVLYAFEPDISLLAENETSVSADTGPVWHEPQGADE